MMDDAIHAFDSKKTCTGAALQEARTYEAEIRKRLAAYGITPQDAFSYGRSYLKNNQDTALVNLDIMTRFKTSCPRIAAAKQIRKNRYCRNYTYSICFHFISMISTYPPAFSDLPQYSLELLQRLFTSSFPSGDIRNFNLHLTASY